MRVTAQAKAATRKLILQTARRLFAASGFDNTRTRDIADAAGIASGTLFNYFPTKEAIVACLAAEAMADAAAETTATSNPSNSLEEDLFALVASALRKLKPLRRQLPALLDTSLSPLALNTNDESASLRATHLQAVAAIAARHGHSTAPSPTALQLYWTLYTGILAFWSTDASPRQEDTLALIDDSLSMFVAWLSRQPSANPGTR